MVAVIVPVIVNKFIMTVYHSLTLSRLFRTQTSTSATGVGGGGGEGLVCVCVCVCVCMSIGRSCVCVHVCWSVLCVCSCVSVGLLCVCMCGGGRSFVCDGVMVGVGVVGTCVCVCVCVEGGGVLVRGCVHVCWSATRIKGDKSMKVDSHNRTRYFVITTHRSCGYMACYPSTGYLSACEDLLKFV